MVNKCGTCCLSNFAPERLNGCWTELPKLTRRIEKETECFTGRYSSTEEARKRSVAMSGFAAIVECKKVLQTRVEPDGIVWLAGKYPVGVKNVNHG